MKKFTRIEPTTIQQIGLRYKRYAVIKNFRDGNGHIHEFTTWHKEGGREGAVIAITEDKQVVVAYQFRAGPETWMYELPGGDFNDGEDNQSAALRELKEETGYVSDEVEYLGKTCRDSYVNAEGHYFIATNCRLSNDGQALDQEEEEQGVEVRLISIEQLIDNAKNNRMTDPAAVLMAYDKLKELQHGKK